HLGDVNAQHVHRAAQSAGVVPAVVLKGAAGDGDGGDLGRVGALTGGGTHHRHSGAVVGAGGAHVAVYGAALHVQGAVGPQGAADAGRVVHKGTILHGQGAALAGGGVDGAATDVLIAPAFALAAVQSAVPDGHVHSLAAGA